MTEIATITTHEFDALQRLMEQFKNKENVGKIFNIYLPQIQELEDELFKLLNALDIDAVSGAFLDFIGEIVVLPRVTGLADPRYRQLLKAKIGQNVSEGDPERIVAVFKILTESAHVHYLEINGGNVALQGTMELTDQDEINALFVDMERVVMAGVRLAFIVCADETLAFAFDGAGPPALGFDDGTGTIGGKFATDYEKRLEFAFDGDDEGAGGFGAGAADPFVGGVFL